MGETELTMFITQNDNFGVRKSVRQIWDSTPNNFYSWEREAETDFDVFFNQTIPRAWIESKESVIRHAEEIREKIKKEYRRGEMWIKSPSGIKCVVPAAQLMERIKNGEVELPEYLEIEQEKMKWQQKSNYREEEGKSVPIEEEFVQLRIIKKGGVLY